MYTPIYNHLQLLNGFQDKVLGKNYVTRNSQAPGYSATATAASRGATIET